MRTAPSFQFYPSDFLGGTIHMSAEEVGAYIRFLCHQWHQGGLPNDPAKLERIAGVKRAKLVEVLKKFPLNEDGILKNQRMEDVRSGLEEFRGRGSAGGKRSAAKRQGNSDWGKEMAAKRATNKQRTSNEADDEAGSEGPTNSQSQTQSHTTPNGVEKENAGVRESSWPLLEEVKAYAPTIMATSDCAEHFWHAQEQVGWVYKGQPVRDWRPGFRNFSVTWKANEAQRRKAGGSGNPKHPAYDPKAATQGLTPAQILEF
ncbi:MAG: hypothetical protein JWO08_1184 [Verrucomicrobiaceae bacterium]|nr:hypothetical protein [Verrucomicrobiaceae bacterium]